MLFPTVVRPGYKKDFSPSETFMRPAQTRETDQNEGWGQYWQAKVASEKKESEHEGDETPPEKPVRNSQQVHRGSLGCFSRTTWKLFKNHLGTTSVSLADYLRITLRATSWLHLKSQSSVPNKWMVQFTLRSGLPHLIKFCCVVLCSLWN